LPSYDLLVVGDLNPDVMLSAGDLASDLAGAFGQREQIVQTGRMLLGGSSAITAVAAARLGFKVAFACCIGDDWIGRALVEEVGRQGVDVVVARRAAETATSLTVVVARGIDRAILTSDSTLRLLQCEDVPLDLVDSSRHVHVGGYFLQPGLWPGLPALLERARAGGATTSVDPNWDPSERWTATLAETLPLVDIFLPNAAEAARITGLSDTEAAARKLARTCGIVAVKAGAAGGLACQGEETVRARGLSLQAEDATGAGDNFDAGFLAGRLTGFNVRDSLALAVACGGLSTQSVGGTGVTTTLAQALAAAGLAPVAARTAEPHDPSSWFSGDLES
jgi:sugar/nucleoside kinase (ribokinase family)